MTAQETTPRHALVLPALCRRGDGTEFHAVTVDISVDGIRMRSTTVPLITAQLGCAIRGVGFMEVRVVWTDLTEFVVRVMAHRGTPREAIHRLLGLARAQAPPLEDVRVHRRIVPKRKVVQVALNDGTDVTARILNLSASGVALQLDASLEIGQAIVVGRRPARVARRIAGGIGAAFLTPIDESTLRESTTLDEPASGVRLMPADHLPF